MLKYKNLRFLYFIYLFFNYILSPSIYAGKSYQKYLVKRVFCVSILLINNSNNNKAEESYN